MNDMDNAIYLYKTLYFSVPRFGRWKIEQKIVNELNAPCYRVTNKHTKQFANDDMWIALDKHVVMVRTKESLVHKVNQVFY